MYTQTFSLSLKWLFLLIIIFFFSKLTKVANNDIHIEKFIKDISIPYSAADIVISRAGALAISELTFMEKAMILIPFPEASEDHQLINAKNIESKGACKLVLQNDLLNGTLEMCIQNLFNTKNAIQNLEKKSKQISKPKATENIVNKIMEYI